MNSRYRDSQSVLEGFASSIEQIRVAHQSLTEAVVGIEEWRATIDSVVVPVVGGDERTAWASHVAGTFSAIRAVLNLRLRWVGDLGKPGRKRVGTMLLFVGLALLFLGLKKMSTIHQR
ncbi:hypothetical protein Q9L58_010536 [Maublancomyces gigas]|uniref:Uncharacterized protein n=1 Tax=Discina gigas TaxID=1032678 RepID=A0ABR3G3S9_9PEZI